MNIEDAFSDVLEWESRLIERLENTISPAPQRQILHIAIQRAIQQLRNNPSFIMQLPAGQRNILAALSHIEAFKQQLQSSNFPDNYLQEISALTTLAMGIGWLCGEIIPTDERDALLPLADTRARMIQNQPSTRNRPEPTSAKQDIEDELDKYVQQRKHDPPNSLEFIKFLENSGGFEVDRESKTITAAGWKKPRAFNTIWKWAKTKISP